VALGGKRHTDDDALSRRRGLASYEMTTIEDGQNWVQMENRSTKEA
jgi:hypothetical protein